VTPGPIAPARELLGELLLEVGQPAAALREFEKGMEREPGRLRSLYGAASAAERAGDKTRARSYYEKIAKMTNASSEREELRRVSAWLAQN
jgi:uncharacterized protein HemY